MAEKSIHKTENYSKGEIFLQVGKPCHKIGKLQEGVMRGFVIDSEGNEITTHFYTEGNIIIGSFIPNVNMLYSIQALEDCIVEAANYSEVMSNINIDKDITQIINREFERLNKQQQLRMISLQNLNSPEKYELFLSDFPGLMNRIPHYYVAQYLGITPTQLSRARKALINKCK